MTQSRSIVIPLLLLLACMVMTMPAAAHPDYTTGIVQEMCDPAPSVLITNSTTATTDNLLHNPTQPAYNIRPGTAAAGRIGLTQTDPGVRSSAPVIGIYSALSTMTSPSGTPAPDNHLADIGNSCRPSVRSADNPGGIGISPDTRSSRSATDGTTDGDFSPLTFGAADSDQSAGLSTALHPHLVEQCRARPATDKAPLLMPHLRRSGGSIGGQGRAALDAVPALAAG